MLGDIGPRGKRRTVQKVPALERNAGARSKAMRQGSPPFPEVGSIDAFVARTGQEGGARRAVVGSGRTRRYRACCPAPPPGPAGR